FGRIIADVEFALFEDWRSKLDFHSVVLPDQRWRAVLVEFASVQANEPALRAIADILLAVADPDLVTMDNGRAVDGPAAVLECVTPGLFTSSSLESVNATVTAAREDETLALDDRNGGCRVIGILDAIVA